MKLVLYILAVGCLTYGMVGTRPITTYVVGIKNRFISNTEKEKLTLI